MELKMDVPALAAFLRSEFRQAADDIEIVALTTDGLTLRMQVADRHLRPGGTVSGPAMFMLADAGFYLALLSRIGPVALAVTTNCAIDFMRKPAANADLMCEIRIHKLGRLLAVGDAMIYSEGLASPVARASLTYAIPPA